MSPSPHLTNLSAGLMEKYLFLCIFLPFLLHFSTLSFVHAQVTDISTDKQALLALKACISHDPSNLLTSNWSTSSSVCHWMGITCGARHSRVTALNISHLGLIATLPPQLGNLSFLSTLDINNNSFYGALPEEYAQLRRLKYLVLSRNSLSGELPASIFDNLPNLQLLYLSANMFEGKIPSAISKCKSLLYLSLSFNNFTGAIPKEIGNLTQLRKIYLGFNKLQGEIPKELANLAKLELLSLQNSYLAGTIPSLIFNLSSLISMDFWQNSLTGSLPENMCQHIPNLEELYMDYNHLTGPIPNSLGQCKMLRILMLSNNQFEEHIPRETGNLTLIKYLFLDSNLLTGEIPCEIGNLHNLERLELAINHLVGPVPTTIFNISTMRMLSLSVNQLSGILPLIAELPHLKGLYLWGNNFSGSFPDFITNASKLSILDIESNSFSGFIPSTIGNLKNLEILELKHNYFTSTPNLSFLSNLTNCKILRFLSLSKNPLNSILPGSIGNLSISLEYFFINDCNISGKIPKEIGNLKNLINLQLQGNELIGPVPITMDGLQNLQGLYLQNNKFEGLISELFCHLNELDELNLGGNKFYGAIPACIGNLTALRKLFLGSNRLTSSIPSTFWNLEDLLYFDFSSNSLNGSLPFDLGNLKVIIAINLSRNLFSGEIPIAIGSLENLQSLSLGYNRLQGFIPETFGNLKSLEFLDLFGNNLSGLIPKSLETLLYLKYLNLSFNQLSGEIPRGGSFKNFSAESFMGNLALCGAPQLQVPPCKKSTHRKSRTTKDFLSILLPTSIAFLLVVLVLMFVLIKYWKKRMRPTTNVDFYPRGAWRRISYKELMRATNGFSDNNLLGKGSYGSVYKGRLDEGMEVAVKVFHLDFEGTLTSFEAECDVMRCLRHRNLVKIISSCSNDDFKSLILEYMPNGSLEELLFSEKNVLDISHRLNIMIDVASALEYLHFGYSVPIVHCDLKPSNVLLDENMVAHLSDFSIAKLLGEENSMTQTKTLATVGYMAPEYGREGKISRKGDMYSYGIMLMETFTKKKPTNEMFTEEMSLRRWVGESLCSTVMQVVDTNLLTKDDEHFLSKEECVSSILSLAMECTRESPLDRIIIKEAMRWFQIYTQVKKEFGSFNKHLWGLEKFKPINTQYRLFNKIPVKTSKSESMSKDMVKRPTVIHSFMQAAGLTNGHLITCPRHLHQPTPAAAL
ncbi:probable LRR receptor-like serine/threonine-protein kinase At3g47570 [Mangifera indica]|uniref:probable LRR receptor-like serine/threonine-protein kinase At3g47570 n=1 Tax=Mangifera indica TaxID=29780 RepID=UPI001CFA4AA9|nr:probable LRR receptor-like serine/threonine-protein kinase At3g47570 [Mangifera indica]